MTVPFDIAVYAAPTGNAFMIDIATWLVEAARQRGHAATLVLDGTLPAADSTAIPVVVAPHEFFELSSHSRRERRLAASRSIVVATEQPGTGWFERSLEWCSIARRVLDINRSAVDAAARVGVDAAWLRLGAVPSMDHRAGERAVDVTVLAGLTDHRARRLASMAPSLWHRRSELRLFPTDRPVSGSGPHASGPLFGAAKYDLLASSRILLNLHRDETTTYFEWARAVEAMANGCVVVSEPSSAIEPLRDGEHLVVTDDPAGAIGELLDDPDRLAAIGEAAAALVHGPLRLADSLAVHLADPPPDPVDPPRAVTRLAPVRARMARRRAAFRPHLARRRELLDAVLAERALRDDVESLRCRIAHGDPDHVDLVDSDGRAAATPEVSVVITLYDYADVVTEALDSVAASDGIDHEIVVVDDHSTDEGRRVVTEWMRRHTDHAVRLVARGANRGLAAARNLGFEHARADRVMVLDADNLLAPTALRRLADALDDDPDADFAWSILEVFGGTPRLLSAFAWDPDRLLERNVIDAQVMLRRASWQRLGGYRRPPGLLAGWEDWDLWLRIVEAGGHGVLVPEMLGRYRDHGDSMVSGPNRFNDVMLERLEAAHPALTFPAR